MRDSRRLFWWSFFIAALAVMFGWSAAKDADDLRVCREALTAINNADASITIQRVTATSFSRSIRIDYDIRYAERPRALSRYAICRFSPGAVPPFRSDLSAVITEFGPIPDSKLFLLKRFYLDTEEAESATRIDPQTTSMSAPQRFATHILEWSLNVAPRAGIYMLLAMAFFGMQDLFRRAKPSAFYGILCAAASFLGAMAITGPVSPLAVSLAFMTGIVGGACSIVLYTGAKSAGSPGDSSSLLSWMLFAALVLAAPFWFPGHGIFVAHWMPFLWSQPWSLIEIDSYNISTTLLASASVMLAIIVTMAIPFLLGDRKQERSFLHTLSLIIALAFTAGAAAALGYVQYGLETDPLLIGTKGLFIAVVTGMGNRNRHWPHALVLSLAVASLELGLAPLLTRTTINLLAYGLLVIALFSQPEFRAIIRVKEKIP